MIAPEQPTLSQRIAVTLEHQYAHVAAYCDAQTTLGNILVHRGRDPKARKIDPLLVVPRPPEEFNAVVTIQTARTNLKNDWVAIQELIQETTSSNTAIHTLLEQHWKLSRRVVQTVHDPYHRNGIPVVTDVRREDPNERKTVALATLRASVARLQEAMK